MKHHFAKDFVVIHAEPPHEGIAQNHNSLEERNAFAELSPAKSPLILSHETACIYILKGSRRIRNPFPTQRRAVPAELAPFRFEITSDADPQTGGREHQSNNDLSDGQRHGNTCCQEQKPKPRTLSGMTIRNRRFHLS